MEDSSVVAAPAGEKDKVLETAQAEEIPGKASLEVDKPGNVENGSGDNGDCPTTNEEDQGPKDEVNSHSESSPKDTEPEPMDTGEPLVPGITSTDTSGKFKSAGSVVSPESMEDAPCEDTAMSTEKNERVMETTDKQSKPDSKEATEEKAQEPLDSPDGVEKTVAPTNGQGSDSLESQESAGGELTSESRDNVNASVSTLESNKLTSASDDISQNVSDDTSLSDQESGMPKTSDNSLQDSRGSTPQARENVSLSSADDASKKMQEEKNGSDEEHTKQNSTPYARESVSPSSTEDASKKIQEEKDGSEHTKQNSHCGTTEARESISSSATDDDSKKVPEEKDESDEKATKQNSHSDTPDAGESVSPSNADDTSKKIGEEKEWFDKALNKPDESSRVDAGKETASHSTDISPNASTSGSRPTSASPMSPPVRNATPVKSEDQPATESDKDVEIVDEKKENKKTGVKQEPTESDSKEGQSKKSPRECIVCRQVGKCKYNIVRNGCTKHLCDDLCYRTFKQQPAKYLRNDASKTKNQVSQEKGPFCSRCNILITDQASLVYMEFNGEKKEFCGERCKSRFVTERKEDDDDEVEIVGTSNVSSSKSNQGTCCMCQQQGVIKHEMHVNKQTYKLCSNTCFHSFSKQRNLNCELCEQCVKPCQKLNPKTQCIQFEGRLIHFCSQICLNVYKTTKQKIVSCCWCHAKKSNFDMVERIDGSSKFQVFCSLNCLSLYRVQLQATSQTNVMCDQCRKPSPAQYHLTMSDASVRNFCTYECVVQFQKQFMPPSNNVNLSTNKIHQNIAAQAKPPPVPPAVQAKTPPVPPARQSSRQAAKAKQNRSNVTNNIPVISNVVSLAPTASHSRAGGNQTPKTSASQTFQQVNTFSSNPYQVVIEQPSPVSMKNKGILTRPTTQTKATSCRPNSVSVETQTDEELSKPKGLLPIPIPIYVPVPLKMYNHPVPYPMPIPVPVPIPVFIPTTKKSANGILKHIQELQHKIPEDPFEAELLQMAEAVATAEKAPESSDSEDDTGADTALPADESFEPSGGPLSNTLGEDIVQAALRLSQGFDQPVLDLEDSLEPSCINPEAPGTRVEYNNTENEEPVKSNRGKRRGRGRGRGRPATKKRKVVEEEEEPVADSPVEPPPPLPSDADFALKFTYGVNAWTHWVIGKNAQNEEEGGPKKRFKTSLLACSAEELNKSLCLFVKEVRKPNGDEYAADSIYYLCLGIQQYLYENGRIDNIFTDWYFDKFAECLDEVLNAYEPKVNDYGLIVCRLEEEHLWECKQLGAHSPHVLLMTLIYFNTKFFMLRSADDHLRLSFSHVVKHWKKSPIGTGGGGGRSVYLKYYTPTAQTTQDNRRKKDEPVCYEQMENADNPLRCPVKLYEFYLSKCPESIRNRNDVFYLVPERSCVPDSPVWYSTQNLTQDLTDQLLHRVQVVREIQESFLIHP